MELLLPPQMEFSYSFTCEELLPSCADYWQGNHPPQVNATHTLVVNVHVWEHGVHMYVVGTSQLSHAHLDDKSRMKKARMHRLKRPNLHWHSASLAYRPEATEGGCPQAREREGVLKSTEEAGKLNL